MLIIFIAHTPENPWLAWIPARFGFSSATELFVFGSGFASAIAFGRTFTSHGFYVGTLRITKRIWQLYWAHLSLFVVLIGLTVLFAPADSHAMSGLTYFFTSPADAISGLVTLRYVPILLDILPLYIIVLALVPVMMAAHRLHPALPFLISGGLYLATHTLGLAMPGRPDTSEPWFFNPFAWQILFFMGYSIGLKWWTPPSLGNRWLMALCALFVIVSVPFNFWAFTDALPGLVAWQMQHFGENTWTNLHPVRIVHFLALAYLTLALLERARWLLDTKLAKLLTIVGTQSLPAFLACTALAWGAGIALDSYGYNAFSIALINITGLAGVVAAAWIAKIYKAEPWAKPATPAA